MWSIHMCNLLHNNIRMNTLTFQLEVLSELLFFFNNNLLLFNNDTY